MASYTFDNAAVAESTDRFTSLQHCYDPVTVQRLEALGVAPGWRCLEVGAGSGSIAGWLGRRVGNRGSVLATDIDTALLGDAGPNVQVQRHDIIKDPLPAASFDLVHARLVLLHLPQRRRALHRIWHALKPGGHLLLEDFDCTWLRVLTAPDPESARLFVKVVAGIHELLHQAGADLAWGRHAYQALLDTGYIDLDVHGYAETWPGGSTGVHLHRANAQQTAHRLVEQGLTRAELEKFLDLLDDSRFAASSYLMMSTAGRRPASQDVPTAKPNPLPRLGSLWFLGEAYEKSTY